MLRFASTALALVAAVATSETDSGVRKQVRVAAHGLTTQQDEEDGRRQTRKYDEKSDDYAVRRQAWKRDEKNEVDHLASEKVEVGYTMHSGLDCITGLDVPHLEAGGSKPSGLTLSECQSRCTSDERCGCLNFENVTGTCSMLKYCVPEKCSSASLADLYVQSTIYVVDGVAYRRAGGWTCGASSGATMIDTDASARVNVTPTECLRECNQDPSCGCTRYSRFYSMKCWKMRGCPSEGHRLHECDRSERLDTYIQVAPATTATTAPSPSPTLAPFEHFATAMYCFGQAITHRHGQAPAGSYASQATCEALCDSASTCKFYLWRHDPNAMSKYVCATFTACDDMRPFTDGDGGNIWRKTGTPTLTHNNGFVDLGMGRCCGHRNCNGVVCNSKCADPTNIFRRGEAANCERICGGDPQCFGYSTTDEGHCWLWTERNLSFGGDLIAWEGARCNVKSCVLDNSCPVCEDVAGWTNGFGFGCHSYQVHFCEGGMAKAGQEHWLGSGMNHPENNCCACGGGR